MRKIFDAHSHSQFSFDGKRTTIERSSFAAKKKGLNGICFTDHCDIFVPEECLIHETIKSQEFDIIAQQAEIDRIRDMLGGEDFHITKGIEIGMNRQSRKEIAEVLRNNSFDQVIASIHYLENSDPYHGGFFEGKDWKQAYGVYLETIHEEMILLKDFDIIGHYDYVARYSPYPQDCIAYKDFSDIFDTIFRYLIENGKGLEINTKSCSSSKGRKTITDNHILLRYKELGGEIISLGSDSHDSENVGDNFEYHASLLRSLGFRWSSHYEKRKLVQLPL